MIKPEANQSYFAHHPAERDLASKLDEAFDITFGKAHGQLSFWLAQPKRHTTERFGLSQEVLVIYSPHAKTDARVLTAIENIFRSPDFKHRVEKVLFLLIHSGDQSDVEDLVRRQADRIIVPFHVTEFGNSARGNMFLRSRVASAIGALDLFGMSSPITSDRYFFGRDELVQMLMMRTLHRRENAGLFGLRKTGKTSVLYAIQRRISASDVRTEYIDCHNPGVHSARWWEVLRQIAKRCASTLTDEQRAHLRCSRAYTITTAGVDFLDDLQKTIEYGHLSQIVLMFDEIEFITHTISNALGRHWDQDFLPFWQTIRSAHQETRGQITFIVAGVNPASIESSHFGLTPNPIFQLASPHYLEPLSVVNVRSMVRTIGRYAGLQFDENTYAYLQQSYGGHPYLIRLVCSEVWRGADILNPETREKIRVGTFQRLKTATTARLAQPIRDILLSLVWWYPDDYDVLRILASGDKAFVAEYLKDQPGATLQFAKYGLLRADTGEFAIADVREFLNQWGDAYKNEISPFMRTDLPQQLLPEIPDLAALSALFEKRVTLEGRLRKVIMLYLHIKSAWDVQKVAKLLFERD